MTAACVQLIVYQSNIFYILSLDKPLEGPPITIISRNFARAIIVFKHHFSPALQQTRRQYESFKKLKHRWRLFFSFRVQLGVKTDPALIRTRVILREITVPEVK